jgi:hypothetical protein
MQWHSQFYRVCKIYTVKRKSNSMQKKFNKYFGKINYYRWMHVLTKDVTWKYDNVSMLDDSFNDKWSKDP